MFLICLAQYLRTWKVIWLSSHAQWPVSPLWWRHFRPGSVAAKVLSSQGVTGEDLLPGLQTAEQSPGVAGGLSSAEGVTIDSHQMVRPHVLREPVPSSLVSSQALSSAAPLSRYLGKTCVLIFFFNFYILFWYSLKSKEYKELSSSFPRSSRLLKFLPWLLYYYISLCTYIGPLIRCA